MSVLTFMISMIRRLLLFIVVYLTVVIAANGQSQYVSAFDYRTPALSPVGVVPGVNWLLGDNSAYDANHQRLFFQGSYVNSPPWQLFSYDVTTGTVLRSVTVPANNLRGSLLGLQYDNSVDTLYGMYYDGTGGLYLAWVDIGTGVVHSKKAIAGFAGYSGSAYDVRDHLYIFYGGQQLVSLDARTGNQVYYTRFPIANMEDLVYDNTNNTLYGISLPGYAAASLNSIDLSSAALNHLVDLPVNSFLQLNTYAIDEVAGNYLFVGTLPAASGCVNYEFYSVALGSGAVNYSSLYPYAQDPTDPLDSNLVEWSFDQSRGKLYALNWRPTTRNVTPFFTIAGANPSCPGEPDVFTATLTAPLTANNYEWRVNGVLAGGDASVYTEAAPVSGDAIFCILTATSACGTVIKDTSNVIALTVGDTAFVSAAVIAPGDSVCAGSPITFTAVVGDGGLSPVYQWMVNGVAAGVDSPGFTFSPLPGDGVSVRVKGDQGCVDPGPATSTVLRPVVVPVTIASLTIDASASTICSGDTVVFSAEPVDGGSSPHYQWEVNGAAVGADAASFSSASLADGDVVSCVLSSSVPCVVPVAAVDPVSMTVRATPVLRMPPDTLMARGSTVVLTPAVTGDILSYVWLPAVGLNDPSLAYPTASPLNTTTYVLTVTAGDGCSDSGKVMVRIYTPLSMPDAFTPNGDGRNDVFRIPPSLSISFSRMSVYDRWGQRVFMTTDVSSGWDGTVDGRAEPAGAYVWIIEYADAVTGKALMAKGTVILVR